METIMANGRGKEPQDELPDADVEAREAAKRSTMIKAGIGIGSAALVAAFLYANKARKKKVDNAE